MHIEDIHIEIIGIQLHFLEHHLEGGGHTVADVHHLIRLRPQGLLDKAQQLLLVHARRRVDVSVHFPDGDVDVMVKSFLHLSLSLSTATICSVASSPLACLLRAHPSIRKNAYAHPACEGLMALIYFMTCPSTFFCITYSRMAFLDRYLRV